jgi:hypothetical protein
MENYKNARDLLKKELYDKLMCDRFGWELNINGNTYILDIPLTKEEHHEKIVTVEKIIRELIFELDNYIYIVESQAAEGEVNYLNVPTIFCLMNMSIEFDDTPIKEEDVYVVDESTINRTPNLEYDNSYDEFKEFNKAHITNLAES